jgi:putative thioredoxin
MQQPRDFSLYGAVDLGARQAAAQRSQQATARADGPGGHVIDVSEESFNEEVVERSRSTPVILDLWADWCGPCKQLSPILEKLADAANGAWVLAKVDIDANPQLRAALQVQSIPMVMAVVGGQVVDGFLGAMPEAQVSQWVGQVMQVAEQLGVAAGGGAQPADGSAASAPAAPAGPGGPAGPAGAPGGMPGPGGPRPGSGAGPGPGPGAGPGPGPAGMMADPAFDDAQQAMERGDLDGAAAAFERVLAATPGHPVAALGLAQVDLIRRVTAYDEGEARRAAAGNPADVAAQSKVADIEVASGRPDEGFDRLLGVIRRTSGDARDAARAHLVKLFEVFPPGDPRVAKARAQLSSLLF